MKHNYPVAHKGGIAQQAYEARTRIQLRGVKRLLLAANVQTDRVKMAVDLGCRGGDTTLGILQAIPGIIQVIGIEEVLEAVILASLKFHTEHKWDNREAVTRVKAWKDAESGLQEFFNSFTVDSSKFCNRHQCQFDFAHLQEFTQLPDVFGGIDLIVGFQILHWLDAADNGLPKPEIIKAVYDTLASGGVFIGGTSTAFIHIDQNQRVEGKTRAEFSIDEHPFVKMVYERIKSIVQQITLMVPVPVTAAQPLKEAELIRLFTDAGFIGVQTGAFLVTPGREEVTNGVVRLRPEHQGRLEGVPQEQRTALVEQSIKDANAACDSMQTDPRLDNQHIYDAVPFLKATKP